MPQPGSVRHPATLPSHLDIALYTDFLSQQPPILNAMEEEILHAQTNPESLHQLKRRIHTLKGEAGFFQLSSVAALCHAAEDRMETEAISADLCDLLLSVQSWLSKAFRWYMGFPDPIPDPPDALLQKLTAPPLSSSGQKTETLPTALPSAPTARVRETVLVDAKRLDRLVDTIGELVIAETMVRQSLLLTHSAFDPVATRLGQLTKISRTLQEIGLSLRMVSIRPTFMKMERMVHELSRTLEKPIQCVLAGEETRLDRSLVEKIRDPLLHLIRNAMDHGMEPVPVRKQNGKPETGTIRIEARHQRGEIEISISDDGAGLDRSAIFARAVKQGLVAENARLTDSEIEALIFTPGFSTAKTVTELSGRGVGMDVVQEQVTALSGTIRMESTPGSGTTFRILIPLTLAIIDGIVCEHLGATYILPSLAVIATLPVNTVHFTTLPDGGRMAGFQDRQIPAVRLDSLLTGADPPDRKKEMPELMVVLEEQGAQMGVLLENVAGKQQVVVKSLGKVFRAVKGLSGAAILPDGTVGLILDPAFFLTEKQKRNRHPPVRQQDP